MLGRGRLLLTVSRAAKRILSSWSRITSASWATSSITPLQENGWLPILRFRGQIFQDRALVRIHDLTLFFHLLLNPYSPNDKGIDPTSDHPLVLLTLILKEFKKWPKVSQHASRPDQLLETHKGARERGEPVLFEREGIEVFSEEEFRSDVDSEPRNEVLEVERVARISIKHNVDGSLGMLFEQAEVRYSVCCEKRPGNRTVLRES